MNKLITSFAILFVFMAGVPAYSEEDTEREITRDDYPFMTRSLIRDLKKRREKAIRGYNEEITDAVNEFKRDMKKELKKAMSSGDMELTKALMEEIERADELVADLEVPEEAVREKKWVRVEIQGAAPMGTKIGELKKGDKVEIAYHSGTWGHSSYHHVNPDELPSVSQWSDMAVCRIENGNRIEIVRPKNTADDPHVFEAPSDGVYALCITDVTHNDNQGTVVYGIRGVR